MYEKGDYLTVTPNKYGPEHGITAHGSIEEAQAEAQKECEDGTPSYVVKVINVAQVTLT